MNHKKKSLKTIGQSGFRNNIFYGIFSERVTCSKLSNLVLLNNFMKNKMINLKN